MEKESRKVTRPPSIISWSIFGREPALFSFSCRVEPEASAIDRAARMFAKSGAILGRRNSTSFNCLVPSRKFLGITYGRRATIPCRVEIDTEAQWPKPNTIVTCDLDSIRNTKRLHFYALSLLFFLIVFGRFLMGEWTATTWLFLSIPWPLVEINFFADRHRLRTKLLRLLKSASSSNT